MPVDRDTRLSISQFAELLGLDPKRFIGVDVHRPSSTIVIVQEPKEERMCGPDPTGHP